MNINQFTKLDAIPIKIGEIEKRVHNQWRLWNGWAYINRNSFIKWVNVSSFDHLSPSNNKEEELSIDSKFKQLVDILLF
jgi:hypothetical protein